MPLQFVDPYIPIPSLRRAPTDEMLKMAAAAEAGVAVSASAARASPWYLRGAASSADMPSRGKGEGSPFTPPPTSRFGHCRVLDWFARHLLVRSFLAGVARLDEMPPM